MSQKPILKNETLSPQSLEGEWQSFIQSMPKDSKLRKAFAPAKFSSYKDTTLTLYFSDEALSKIAKAQSENLKQQLRQSFKSCKRVDYCIGDVPIAKETTTERRIDRVDLKNPLQILTHDNFGKDNKDNDIALKILKTAADAENSCDQIYQKLTNRTKILASDTLSVSFNWRIRVGGTRGFRELLLPVFHPVFGVPYIPAASLKGAARAWARQNGALSSEINEILGMLEGKVSKAAKVEFLDAFPTAACLSVDVATPQWSWNENHVTYSPSPHHLLSMEQPTFLLGLRSTRPEHKKHIIVVKEWLENALKQGIGSRVSSGYGKALGQAQNSNYHQTYEFELLTQGIYGGDQYISEIRPTAVRGILRYWFRAIALNLYSASNTQVLEEELFGALGSHGKLSIGIISNPSESKFPYKYTGKILLDSPEQKYLNLLSKLLVLAVHLGGVGRGSRRPLHLLHGRMRGCHWNISDKNLPLKLDLAEWQSFFKELRSAFSAVRLPDGNFNSDPGEAQNRYQDTLDNNAQVWLLPSINQTAPEKVTDWQKNGNEPPVLGSALSLLYANEKFKGKNKEGIGNVNVGGKLGTPSFVWIKSIFPYKEEPYQVITIFGVDHPDRLEFAKALQQKKATLVFGSMPPSSSPL